MAGDSLGWKTASQETWKTPFHRQTADLSCRASDEASAKRGYPAFLEARNWVAAVSLLVESSLFADVAVGSTTHQLALENWSGKPLAQLRSASA